jgi:hypothetical protein
MKNASSRTNWDGKRFSNGQDRGEGIAGLETGIVENKARRRDKSFSSTRGLTWLR